MNYKIVILAIFLLASSSGYSQMAGDEILLNENAIQRPLTLHKYQFRLSSGYIFHIYNSRYDSEGNKIQLSESGNASSRIDIPIQIQYGLFDFLELSADLNYFSQTWREPQLQISTSLEGSTAINTFARQRGIPVLNFDLNVRVPWNIKALDLMGKIGYGIPLASPDDPEPTHTLMSDNGTRVITNNWNYASGKGTGYLNNGLFTKLRLEKLAFILFWTYSVPTSTSQGLTWSAQLNGENFEYSSSEYLYLTPEVRNLTIRADYLLYPWFDLILQVDNQTQTDAWTEVTGKRVAKYDTSETLLAPGFEILVTHRLWLRQRIALPISGKSTLTSTSIQTFLSYNLFTK